MSTFAYALPDVGEGLDRAEIMSWKVSVGDAVVPDQVLAEVETDKSMVEVPSPVAGIVTSLAGELGDFIEVGSLFVEIEVAEAAGGHEPSGDPAAPDAAAVVAVPKTEAPVTEAGPVSDLTGAEAPIGTTSPATAPGRTRVLASPATRRFAADSGVDLALVPATGPNGRVTKADVEAHLAAATAPAGTGTAPAATSARDSAPVASTALAASATALASTAPAATSASGAGAPHSASVGSGPTLPQMTDQMADESIPFRGLRRTIAANMVESWRTIPHITDFREIDASGLVEARARLNAGLAQAGRDEKVTYLPFLIRAVALALRQHREFNSRLDEENERITFFGRRNIGLAVSTDAGLFVPVVHDADSKLLLDLSRESADLAQRARDRTITSAQMGSGTFTITNFGSYGGWLGTPIIRPPEVAIAGFGRIADKVVAVDGQPVVRNTLPLAVSADHRVIDGANMGEFLGHLTRLLENPILLAAGDL